LKAFRGVGAVAVVVVATLSVLTFGALPAGADDFGDRRVTTDNDGRNASGTAEEEVPGHLVVNNSGGGGPNCTKPDGPPDYLRYEPLQYTTMQEQRTEIRPDEQRPGQYLHVYCGDSRIGFYFFPDDEPVDPRFLAETVTITPPAPVLRTSPAAAEHLVDIEAWFWAENWEPIQRSATAGTVTVTVSAEPAHLLVDPGDGSPPFTCAGPQPVYDPSLPASSQSSGCTHTYTRAGNYTATATVVYDVSFTSNVGVNGGLGTIEPGSTLPMAVSEAQAINNGG
jgi:hypothetical protein